MSVLIISGVLPAWGRDYFDPGLLRINGQQGAQSVDLSQFETAGQIAEGKYLVSVFVNQSDRGQHTLVFQKNAQGALTPALTPEFLHYVGVNTESLPAFKNLPRDVPVDNLKTRIPQAQIKFDFSQLRLELSIPQIAMQPKIGGYVDPALWDDGMPSLLFNYTLNGNRNWQDARQSDWKGQQTSIFANVRSGFNVGPWRLRSDVTYTQNEYQSAGQRRQRLHNTQFMNTYIQRDIRPWRSEILAGENATGNEVFDSIPFRGVKLNSSEPMLPNSLRGFAPIVSGIAESNARVSISQNGNVIYQTYVAPGPFTISDLYQTGLAGDLTVTITESDGRVRTQTIAYSSLPTMLRPGALKYELTTGRYHGGVTDGSQKLTFGLGTLIYGLPHNVTLYGGGLLAKDYFSAVVGSGVSLGNFGAISADITAANAKLRHRSSREQGASYRLRYAKSLLSTGTAIDLAAYRYSTRNYYSFSDVNNLGYQLSEGQVPWALDRRRSSFQMRISQEMGEWGALYLSSSRDDYWGRKQVNNTLSAGFNGSIGSISYGLAYSIDRVKGDGNWPENRQLSMNVQVPLSLFSHSEVARNSYASYQMTHSNGGGVQQQAGINGSALDNRLSYSAMQGWTNGNTGDNGASSTLNLGYQGSQGAINMGYSHAAQYRSLHVGASGGLVIHPQGATLSQTLGSSVALIRAPGAVGTTVMNGNTQIDSRGYAVVPYLSDYQKNNIILNPATLPDDVDITQSSIDVYPTKGAVVMANFATRVGLQALITLRLDDGVVPFGAVVALAEPQDGEEIASIVGDAGQSYLGGLPESGHLTVKWGKSPDQQCLAAFQLAGVIVSENNPIRQLTVACEKKHK
ncbi:fimbria/pilus outer membrane usher protein [Serratia sp. NPDC078593]|uniref:fimbria/pilus outer membrane usher protein n=1 Tax=unclassified Serratia (in: enterobacteria) TaxID=2647522 RepID=UPI0037D80051